MKLKIILIIIIVSVIYNIFSIYSKSNTYEIDTESMISFNFNDINIEYPFGWLFTNVDSTKSVIKNRNEKQGIILTCTPYNDTNTESALNNAYTALKSSVNSEISKEITNTSLGETMNIEFTYNDLDLQSCISKASIFVYGNSAYTIEYYEVGTELVNSDFIYTLLNSISLNEITTAVPTETQVEITSSNTTNINNADSDETEYVYIGKSGNKYHKATCSTIKGNGTAITLAEAKALGREPCKRCNP